MQEHIKNIWIFVNLQVACLHAFTTSMLHCNYVAASKLITQVVTIETNLSFLLYIWEFNITNEDMQFTSMHAASNQKDVHIIEVNGQCREQNSRISYQVTMK